MLFKVRMLLFNFSFYKLILKSIEFICRFDGLWTQCEQMPNGNTNCESYNVFFIGLPGRNRPQYWTHGTLRGSPNLQGAYDHCDWTRLSGYSLVRSRDEMHFRWCVKPQSES